MARAAVVGITVSALLMACTGGSTEPTESPTPVGEAPPATAEVGADDGSLAWEVFTHEHFRPSEVGGSVRGGAALTSGWLLVGMIFDGEQQEPRPVAWQAGADLDFEPVDLPAEGPAGALDAATDGRTVVVVGNEGGPGRTPAAVWRSTDAASFERVKDATLAPDEGMTLWRVVHADGVGFLAAGAGQDQELRSRPRLLVSQDGTAWSDILAVHHALEDARSPQIADIAVWQGQIVLLVDESIDGMLRPLVLFSGDLESWERVELPFDGAEATAYSLQAGHGGLLISGGVRQGAEFAPVVWRASAVDQWEAVPAQVNFDENVHTSFSSYGNDLREIAPLADGWIGVAYVAASYLPVFSPDGVNWDALRLPPDTDDTELPWHRTVLTDGSQALLAAASRTRPSLVAVEGGRLRALPPLTPPAEALELYDAAVVDGTIWIAGERWLLTGSAFDTPEQGAVVWRVDGDEVERHEARSFRNAHLTAFIDTDEGLAIAGHDRFVREILDSTGVRAGLWTPTGSTWLRAAVASGDGDVHTSRARGGVVHAGGLVLFGSGNAGELPSAPLFWHRTDGREFTQMRTAEYPEDVGAWVWGMCPIGDRLVAFGSQDGDAAREHRLWHFADGTWSRWREAEDNITADLPHIFGCDALRDEPDRVMLVGGSGDPSRPLGLVIDADGMVESLELPDLGDGSLAQQVRIAPDGTAWIRGTELVDGTFTPVLLAVSPGEAVESFRLDAAVFRSPNAQADSLHLASVDKDLILVGMLDGVIQIWRAPRP